ncbi:MAG: VWA domain-containing protein, partial [Chloroflexi bacterium]|nr:VWA domain-containing protein [Chloroflexota bacterium]
MSKQGLFYIYLCALAALVWPVSLSAQATQPEAREINTEATQEDDGFVLRSLFTILDSNNFPVLNNEVQIQGPGQIQLIGQQSAPVEATIEPANTPIKIALVIDASGSMQQEIGDVKAAAQKFVDKAPNNAQIAVFSFARQLEQKQDFTPKEQANVIKNAIVSIQNLAPGTDNTCIYDAAFGAINSLNNAQNTSPQERRAVVLFTDGIDNERKDPSVACSDIKEPNVISQANEINQNRIPVQIHTMGLCVPSNTNECPNVERERLINLSKETFAYSKIGKIDELDTMFDTILAGLNSQWMATTKVKAIKGQNTAALRFSVNVRDAEPQTVGFDTTFSSPVDQTIAAPTLKMSNPTFDAEANAYNVQIDVSNFTSVSNITLEVVSEGGSVNKEVFSTISAAMPVAIKADKFTAGKEYAFELSAADLNGAPITNDKGEAIIERRIIKHDPALKEQLSFAIKDADINWSDKTLNIQLDNVRGTQGKSLLYSGQINDESRLVTEIGPDVLQGTQIKIPLSEQELKLVQDAGGQKEYTINLTLREEGTDQGFTLPQPYKDKPTIPQQLSLLQRVGQTIRNPVVLSSILVIVLLVSAVSIYLITRNR